MKQAIALLPDEILKSILQLAAPDTKSKKAARLVCQLWANAIFSLKQHISVYSMSQLKAAAEKAPGLCSLTLPRDLKLSQSTVLDSIARMHNLTSLRLRLTSRAKVPSSLGVTCAPQLHRLEFELEQSFTAASLTQLTSLKALTLGVRVGARNHKWQLQPLTSLERLTELELRPGRIQGVLSLTALTQLHSLRISGHSLLSAAPMESLLCLSQLRGLRQLHLQFLELASISLLADLTRLEDLSIYGYGSEDSRGAPPLDFSRHSRLRELKMHKFELESFPRFCASLTRLQLAHCDFPGLLDLNLQRLAPSLESLKFKDCNVGTLRLSGAASLSELECVDMYGELFDVHLEGVTALKRLALQNNSREFDAVNAVLGLGNASRLESLLIAQCPYGQAIPEICTLTCLEFLLLEAPYSIPSLALLQRLHTLVVRSGSLLDELPGIGALDALRELELDNIRWSLLETELHRLMSLNRLQLRHLVRHLPPEPADLECIGQLTSLTSLDLAPNHPVKARPDLFSGLTCLRHLALDDSFDLAGYASVLALSLLQSFTWQQQWDCSYVEVVDFVVALKHLTRVTFKFKGYVARVIDRANIRLAAGNFVLEALRQSYSGKVWELSERWLPTLKFFDFIQPVKLYDGIQLVDNTEASHSILVLKAEVV